MLRDNPKLAGRIACIVGIALFIAACEFPAIGTCSENAAGPSINWFENTNIVLFGWLAAFVGQVGWYANIPFGGLIVIILAGQRPHKIFITTQAAFLFIALVTLSPNFGAKLPHNEAFSERVCALGPGFWLWVCSQIVVMVAGIAGRSRTEVATPING